jgi:hypothetical protein
MSGQKEYTEAEVRLIIEGAGMKCKVKDCENHEHEGLFIGFLCSPCYRFLNTGEGKTSQLYRNTIAAEREECASIEVHLTTPDRDYTNISPLDAYEAALMDAAMAFREAIRARNNDAA